MIGLCGAHRTGKSTLAKVFSEKTGIPMVSSSSINTHRRLGISQASDLEIGQRIDLQHAILDDYVAVLNATKGPFIADRTPIDMAAYLLADVRRTGLTEGDETNVAGYIQRCLEITDNRFYQVLFVPPGIPYVADPSKPPPSRGYQEHIHFLIAGLLEDERMGVGIYALRRHCTTLADRLAYLMSIHKSGMQHLSEQASAVVSH